MKLGIDIRPLQSGHRYRGIGEVTKQVTNHLLQIVADSSDDVEFLFYVYEKSNYDPLELLDVPRHIKYRLINQGIEPELDKGNRKATLLRHLREMYGSPIRGASESDVFLQFDYALGVPGGTKTYLVAYDLIPLVFWRKYFVSAWQYFRQKALRTTLRTAYVNHKYMRVLKRNFRKTDRVLAISEHTKHDLKKYLNISNSKVEVVPLGADVKQAKTSHTTKSPAIPNKPYLLFIGAADARRRIEDLVSAFNNLKAEGSDLQLVLAGENFQSPVMIPNEKARKAVMSSSYSEDILTLGYIDDKTKEQLYQNALAYVYPTTYEGFGLPVLEAMLRGCLVVSYKNSSIPEVGGDHVYYASNWEGIKKQVEIVQRMSLGDRKKHSEKAHKHAMQFTWDKTASDFYKYLANS